MDRRTKIALTPEEQKQYLESSQTIILCTVDKHGYPHAVAMWYWVDENGAVLMTTYGKAQKVLNIKRNPKVTLLVESGKTYETLKGLMIRGKGEIVEDTDLATRVLTGIYLKSGGSAAPGIEEIMKERASKRAVIKITPERVSSWDHAKLGGGY